MNEIIETIKVSKPTHYSVWVETEIGDNEIEIEGKREFAYNDEGKADAINYFNEQKQIIIENQEEDWRFPVLLEIDQVIEPRLEEE
tara:strand:- start:119 stop:376 length:258 start_codon:yes stop_codon:yes gene_type:complete